MAPLAQLSLKKWGNGAGWFAPQALLQTLHASVGDRFRVEVRPDGSLLLTPEQPCTVRGLLQDYEGPAPEPFDWGDGNDAPMGRELW